MYIALYARQSIERENSISIETQLEYCRGMIKPDEKMYSIKSFSDKGYSGKDTNRPDFQKLMKDIRRGKVKKVIPPPDTALYPRVVSKIPNTIPSAKSLSRTTFSRIKIKGVKMRENSKISVKI